MDVRFEPVQTAEEINTMCTLAAEIWQEHFTPILEPGQVPYMVEKFQSVPAVTKQIQEGYEYRLITVDGEPAGYTGFHPDGNGKLFLSKLYVHKSYRGTGLARKAFTYLQERCREEGLSAIWLTVNRFNTNTIQIYRHFGFTVVREEKADIGNGYYMDDYILEVPVEK